MPGTTALGKRTPGSRPDDKRYAPRAVRPTTFPGLAGLPTLTGETITVTTVGTDVASSITSAVNIAYTTLGKWTVCGSGLSRKIGAAPGLTAIPKAGSNQSTWALETILDTSAGAIEIVTGRASVRVILDGKLLSTTASITANPTGSSRVTTKISGLGTNVRRKLRFEFTGADTFCSFNIAPTDALAPASRHRIRTGIMGDSFTQPTIVDSGTTHPFMGFGNQLGYMLDTDIVLYGWGGSGYQQAGNGNFGNYSTRFAADVLTDLPDRLIFTGGLNDYGKAGFSYASMYASVLGVLQQARAVLPGPDQIIVISPFWSGGYGAIPVGLVTARDAIKAASTAVGAIYIETLIPAATSDPLSGLLTSAAGSGSTFFYADTNFLEAGVPMYVQIGTGAAGTGEVRKVTGTSGTGPYFHNLSPATLPAAHSVGEPVLRVSESMLSGTGKQGTVVGDGNADRFTGSDGTHPTIAGHLHIASNLFAGIADALLAL